MFFFVLFTRIVDLNTTIFFVKKKWLLDYVSKMGTIPACGVEIVEMLD